MDVAVDMLETLGRCEAYNLHRDALGLMDTDQREGAAVDCARRLVSDMKAAGVDQWGEIAIVLAAFFVTQLRLAHAITTLVNPTPN